MFVVQVGVVNKTLIRVVGVHVDGREGACSEPSDGLLLQQRVTPSWNVQWLTAEVVVNTFSFIQPLRVIFLVRIGS